MPTDLGHGSHSNRGVRGILVIPWLYRLFAWAIAGPPAEAIIAKTYIRAFPGCRVLDLGCGPGRLPSMLSEPIGEFFGVDTNPAYISAARARWEGRLSARFVCTDIADFTASECNHYDIVTAISIIHHLNDSAARHLFSVAYDALAPGGRLVTWDCVIIEGQHPVARWLIEKDRGRAVRTEAGYRRLASEYFDDITVDIVHDALRVPYTICAMTCTKRLG